MAAPARKTATARTRKSTAEQAEAAAEKESTAARAKSAGAKTPKDRQPAASTVAAQADGGQITVTVDGHQYTIEQGALDDFELLDDLAELEKQNAARLPSLLRRLIGPDQYRQAMERLRDPDTGRVDIETGADFVGRLFEAANPN